MNSRIANKFRKKILRLKTKLKKQKNTMQYQGKSIFKAIMALQDSHGKTHEKLDILLDLANLKPTKLEVANKISFDFQSLKTDKSPEKINHFSFRLKDLSMNSNLNTISPIQNISNENFELGSKAVQSPFFPGDSKHLCNSDRYLFNNSILKEINETSQNIFSKNLENSENINLNEINNLNYNLSNFSNIKTLKKKIEEDFFIKDNLNKSANDIKPVKVNANEKKLFNINENDNFENNLSNDNNSVSNFSDIDTLRNELIQEAKKEGTIKKSSVVEASVSEVSSNQNFSVQDYSVSQEKFKKIRGFNFRNNVNTKKFLKGNQNEKKNEFLEINFKQNTKENPENNTFLTEKVKIKSEDKISKFKKLSFGNNSEARKPGIIKSNSENNQEKENKENS